MTSIPQPFVFGYFPRYKYKDLVFYVKNGEHSNMGLFEMPDTKENRVLMDALLPHTTTPSEREQILFEALKINSERFCPNIIDTHYHCCDIEECIKKIFEELRTTTQSEARR